MENNAAKKEFLDACRGLVMNCDCKILVVEIMGEFRAYVAPEVRLKTRECRYVKYGTLKRLHRYSQTSGITSPVE